MIKIEQKQTSKTEEHVKEHCIYTKLSFIKHILFTFNKFFSYKKQNRQMMSLILNPYKCNVQLKIKMHVNVKRQYLSR